MFPLITESVQFLVKRNHIQAVAFPCVSASCTKTMNG